MDRNRVILIAAGAPYARAASRAARSVRVPRRRLQLTCSLMRRSLLKMSSIKSIRSKVRISAQRLITYIGPASPARFISTPTSA